MSVVSHSSVCFILCTFRGFCMVSFTTRAQEATAQGYMTLNHREAEGFGGSPDSQAAARILLPENTFIQKYKLITTATGQILDWNSCSKTRSCTDIHHLTPRAIKKKKNTQSMAQNSQYLTESARGSRSSDASLCVSCI